MIYIWLSVWMYSEKTWPSCGHRSTSLWPPPRQSHFTTCSTSVTHKHTHTHIYKPECIEALSSQTLTHTECPSSPCSEMNEFATVLNHFNHFNGKCPIHGYRSALQPCSYLMCTQSYAPPKNTPTHRHTQTQWLSLLSPVILEHSMIIYYLSWLISKWLLTIISDLANFAA